MPVDESFEDLIRRVREGDQAAAAEIVRRYEEQVRRVVRAGLKDRRVCGLYESGDIAQSVMALFFAGARSGDFDLSKPENLAKLLVAMARNRLIDKARAERSKKRGGEKVPLEGPDGRRIDPADGEPSPSLQVMNWELLDECRKRLSDEERYVVDQRALGRSWQEIAAATGQTPDGVRMRHNRALERIRADLDPPSGG